MASIARSAREFKKQLQDVELTGKLLCERDVDAACRSTGHRWRTCFWTPTITILTFLRQVMRGNCACREAVALTLAKSAACGEGLKRPVAGDCEDSDMDEMSGDPSAYSQARHNLPRSRRAGIAGIESPGCGYGVEADLRAAFVVRPACGGGGWIERLGA